MEKIIYSFVVLVITRSIAFFFINETSYFINKT